MKKFINTILAFIPFCIIIYIILICIWGELTPQFFKPNLYYEPGSYGHLNTRIKEAKQTKNVDLLFLGSSSAYRGFDTRIYNEIGLSAFNLGSSAQSPLQTKILLDQYLKRLNPKTVIFEVNPLIFDNDGVESSLDLIANAKNDLHTLKMMASVKHIKTTNATIFGFYSDLTGKNDGFIEKKKNDKDLYISGGFVEREMMFYTPLKQAPQKLTIKESQLQAFEDILKDLSKKKIKTILVRAPITNSKDLSYSNRGKFDTIMNSYGTYYNFNKIMNLKDSIHFYDEYHLNQIGVKLFNKKIIDILHLKNTN